MIRIDPIPGIQWRQPGQILVGADIVVPVGELGQRGVQGQAAIKLPLPQIFLERAKEALDAPVLPAGYADIYEMNPRDRTLLNIIYIVEASK